MNKILLIATLEKTPSVNEMYVNAGKGRRMKGEFITLKEYLLMNLQKGIFPIGNNTIHHIEKQIIDTIRHQYDHVYAQNVFIKNKKNKLPKPDYRFSLEMEVVHYITTVNGDNYVKFIQDMLAELLGTDDTVFNSAKVTTVYTEKCTPYITVVVKMTNYHHSPKELLKRSLQEIEFQNMDENTFKELPQEDSNHEVTNMGNASR